MFTLQSIISHPKYPFLDIRDPEAYLLSQLHWLLLLREELGPSTQKWDYWLPQDETWDGTNIISIWRADRSKGLVIDQQCVTCDIEMFGIERRALIPIAEEWSETDSAVPYLKLFTRISDDTTQTVRLFLRYWIDPNVTLAALESTIVDYFKLGNGKFPE
jgi:hypothetical protein